MTEFSDGMDHAGNAKKSEQSVSRLFIEELANKDKQESQARMNLRDWTATTMAVGEEGTAPKPEEPPKTTTHSIGEEGASLKCGPIEHQPDTTKSAMESGTIGKPPFDGSTSKCIGEEGSSTKPRPELEIELPKLPELKPAPEATTKSLMESGSCEKPPVASTKAYGEEGLTRK